MGRRGRKHDDDDAWMNWRRETAERLEERRAAQVDPSRGPEAARAAAERLRTMQSAEARRLAGARAAASSSEPFALEGAADMTNLEAQLNVQREYYRSGTALLASTFEPQRHTYYVCGRPVQVPPAVAQHCAAFPGMKKLLYMCVHWPIRCRARVHLFFLGFSGHAVSLSPCCFPQLHTHAVSTRCADGC